MKNLKCPKCFQRLRVDCLASNPPQYEAMCGHCDFELRYFQRKDSCLEITQEELDNNKSIEIKKILCDACSLKESCLYVNDNMRMCQNTGSFHGNKLIKIVQFTIDRK